MKKIIIAISLSLLTCTTQAVDIKADIKTDKALEEELAYLHAENYVYSAGKKMQKIHDVAAAVFVISQEDIHRSGATNIPDALRRVPGLQVAQIDANKWAISARGFNGRFSNKLLIMIDGRAIYTPIFSGVLWNREDTLLEDIERIEVIRGAGAAMWGANAVNGVINIITKNAKDTQGILLTAGAGNQEQGFGSGRYGGRVGDNFYYRVYGKGFKRNHSITVNHENAQDDWANYQGGIKTEWQFSKQDTLTSQADIYQSHAGDKEDFVIPYPPFNVKGEPAPSQQRGGNLQTQWKHKFSDTSESALQIYYKHDDTQWHFISPLVVRERIANIDFQHRFNLLEQHDVIWGMGYRYLAYKANYSVKGAADPGTLQLFSGFLQDDISLLKEQLKLTIGARLEHNDFTGFEIQPNVRLLWTPDNKQSVWGSIARAVRTPSLFETRAKYITNTAPPTGSPLPAFISTTGNPQLKAESVLDYELGYRIQPTAEFSVDITAFYNKYSRLMTAEIFQPNLVIAPYPAIEIPVQVTNKMRGETLGIELTSQWQPTNWLKMQAAYSLLKMNLYTTQGNFADGALVEKDSPQQQVNFKTSLNLPYQFEFDGMLRYVDSVQNRQTPAYVAVDMRLGWKPMKNLEFSVVGQNLFDKQHSEFQEKTFEIPQTQIRRSVFSKVSVSF
jgi:iron complex outermembrane receptor protein